MAQEVAGAACLIKILKNGYRNTEHGDFMASGGIIKYLTGMII